MLFVAVLPLLISHVVGESSAILTAGSYGPEVVNGVINLLKRNCIFDDPLLFLRREAYARTHDGSSPGTYDDDDFNGGIWRTFETDFNATKTDPALQIYRERILKSLYIRWNTINYSDLRKPLYSAIAFQLTAILKSPGGRIPSAIDSQASLWIGGSRLGYARLAAEFLNSSATLESATRYDRHVDLVFVVDSSSNLSPGDFESSKLYVQSVVRNLDLSKVRVSLVTYGNRATTNIYLDNHLDTDGLLTAIQEVTYNGGDVRIEYALLKVKDEVLQTERGGRDDSLQLVVIVAGGQVYDPVTDALIAEQLKSDGVVISSVTVSNSTIQKWLDAVASRPACNFIDKVDSFAELPSLSFSTIQLATQTPIPLGLGSYTFGCNTKLAIETLPSMGDGLTVEIHPLDGELVVYGTGSSTFIPSPAISTFTANATSRVPLQIHIRDDSRLSLALRSIVGTGCMTNVSVVIKPGNHLKTGFDKICFENGITEPCTVTDYITSPFIITGKPDQSIPNSLCGGSSFVASYPGQTDRYLVCSAGTMIAVFCLSTQVYDNTSARCVETATTGVTRPIVTSTPVPVGTPVPVPSKEPLTNPCTAENILNGNFFFPYPGDERKYIHCTIFEGQGIIGDCGEHHFYSASVQTCLNKEPLNTISGNFDENVPNPCKVTGTSSEVQFYEYPGDATLFIHCDQYGDAYIQSCKGLVWSQKSMTCVHGSAVIG